MKKSFKRIKEHFIILTKKTKDLIEENPLVLCYVLGATINGILLRIFTVGEVFSISPLLADFVISLLFASIYFLINKKGRFSYLIICSIVSSFICIANCIYYFYYSSFISITFISFALANYETGNSNVVGDLLQLKFFIFLLFPIILMILNKIFNKKRIYIETKTTRKNLFKIVMRWALYIFILFIFSLKWVDFSRFYTQWNREYLVTRFGVYLYQVNDIVKSIEPSMATLFGSDKANKVISDYYEENRIKESNNEYTDIFKGKNVIAIHAESMQDLVLNRSFNGREVTPNLNKLSKEGMFFSNFYSQVSVGTSSDTEFTLATSLLPINNGTVFVNFSDKTYVSMYDILRDQGYYTFSMHANTGDFWNRNFMHKKLGYDDFYEKESYNLDEKIGFGLSDKSFITQSVAKIKEIAANHELFYGTLITLTNHTPFDEIESYGEFPVTMNVDGQVYSYMEGTKLGNYFKSSHYADEQLGLLIELLNKEGLLENTVIMIYGDHDARIAKSEFKQLYNYDYTTGGLINENDPNYTDIDYYWYELNRKVPLIIWTKDTNYELNVEKSMGMIDVMPTLGNMLGIYNEYALGHDIFEIDDNIVVFPGGNFLTDIVYYNSNKEEYKLLKDVPISDDYIQKNKEYADKILDVSENIIIYDYMKKVLSTERYEVE